MKRALQVILLLWVISTLPAAASFDQFVPNSNQKERLEQAMEYLNSFRNDDANLLLSELISELQKEQALITPFGLSVRYRQADVLEKDHQNELAINILLSIVQDAAALKEW